MQEVHGRVINIAAYFSASEDTFVRREAQLAHLNLMKTKAVARHVGQDQCSSLISPDLVERPLISSF